MTDIANGTIQTRFPVKGPGGLRGQMAPFWVVIGVVSVAYLWITSGTAIWWLGIVWLGLFALGFVTMRLRVPKYSYVELDDVGLTLSYPFPGYMRYDEIAKVWRTGSTVHFEFLYPIGIYSLPWARKRRTIEFEIEGADAFVNTVSPRIA